MEVASGGSGSMVGSDGIGSGSMVGISSLRVDALTGRTAQAVPGRFAR
jgi:hypothetical protein